MHHPSYDMHFFVSHFLRGLKSDVHGPVESQVPATLDHAIRLALIQSEVQQDCKPGRYQGNRIEAPIGRGEAPKAQHKPAQDLWRERQLRDYRRAQGMCYKCGEKYDPTHQCARKEQATVHAMAVEESDLELSTEVLNILATADATAEEQVYLSVHALAGTVDDDTIRIRALVNNQVLLILIESGSTHSFLNSSFLSRVSLPVAAVPSVTVRVANGQTLHYDQMVSQLEWWTQGHTFAKDMRVLPMGAYDAILGMDWLRAHSPMLCDWENKVLQFDHKGQRIAFTVFLLCLFYCKMSCLWINF